MKFLMFIILCAVSVLAQQLIPKRGKAFTQVASSSSDVTDNMVLWLKMNEGSGTTTADSSPTATTAYFTNSPTWTTGKAGNGITFSGANYLNIFTNSALIPSGDFTVACWEKTTTAGQAMVFGVRRDKAGHAGGYSFYTDDAGGGATVFDVADVISALFTLSTDGNWHHYAVTIPVSSAPKFYKDGSLVDTGTTTGHAVYSYDGNLTIGVWNDYNTTSLRNYLTGTLDDVRIYSRILTGAEISSVYANPQ